MGETTGPIDKINMGYVIFNELSYPFKSKHEIEDGLRYFVKAFAAASEMGLTQLRLHKNIGDNLYQLELAPGYLVSHWLYSPSADTLTIQGPGGGDRANDDIKERFKEILTSAPLITENEPIEKEENERSSFEISLDGKKYKKAEGLGAAYLLDTISISFLSILFWDTHHIDNLKHYFLKEDGSDTVNFVSVKHASTPEHMSKHSEWIENKRIQSLTDAKNLWERRDEFFPHIVLCGQVEQQLKTIIGIRSRYFNQIIDRLKRLDDFAKEWTSGGFSDKALKRYGLNVSGESDQTMRKYGRERRFRLPKGKREYFEKHIKTGELRFHFFPDIEEHKIFVGYIGPHLRTVTN
jgi:hypothetical protein